MMWPDYEIGNLSCEIADTLPLISFIPFQHIKLYRYCHCIFQHAILGTVKKTKVLKFPS